MNHADQVEVVGHGSKLPADGTHGEKHSTIDHKQSASKRLPYNAVIMRPRGCEEKEFCSEWQVSNFRNLAQRWVYVLAIDRDGNTDVVIPGRLSDVGNRVPGEGPPSSEIQMTSDPYDFSIGKPFGLDTYILLTSDEELDPRIFPANGVRTRSATASGGASPVDGRRRAGSPASAASTRTRPRRLITPSDGSSWLPVA